jgi:hypothetical protein
VTYSTLRTNPAKLRAWKLRSKKLRSSAKPAHRKAMRKVSRAKRKQNAAGTAQLRRLRKERGDICETKFSQHCRNRAEGRHHLVKQSAGGSDDDSNILLSCNICNGEIEDHPKAAKACGLVLSGHKVVEKGRAA